MAPSTAASSKSSLRKVSFDTSFQRPALKKKVTSPTGSSLLGGFREVSHEIIEPPIPDMAASFLQFCAMCEKQIMTPCNSILYCSEACRRKDGCKPLSAATLTELTPPSSTPSSPSKPILLARTPTGSYTDLPLSARIPPKLHDHRPDLDPTEWKPKLRANRGQQSEAFRYLSQFHRSTTSMGDPGDNYISNITSRADTNKSASASASTSLTSGQTGIINTSSSAATTTTTAASMPVSVPGLWSSQSATPTTTISTPGSHSYFSNANITILSQQYGHTHTGTGTGGYDFNTRPLPLRHNRWYSVSSATPKGTDLVTPHIAPPIVSVSYHEPAISSEDLWGKKVVVKSPRHQGGMRELFGKK